MPSAPSNPGLPVAASAACDQPSRVRIRLVAACLALAAALAYGNTFSAPFIFDDLWSIPYNESIRSFGTALFPPNTNGETVSGRPLVNLTLALNHAISGSRVWSYHALNLLVHIAAGLALFGLVRRTLSLPSMRGRFGSAALPLAALIAGIWMLHPMQTESVTYIVQRAESLMGLFYLLTLYCFARGVASSSKIENSLWPAASVFCCLLGMASKEVMVSAPLMVLFFDRAFVSGSFRGAWGRRRAFYLSLASTWVVMAWLAVTTGSRGTTAGFSTDVPVWTYLLTQCQAITHYLRLAFWPRGLVFDYGTPLVTNPGDVWLRGLLIIALAGATAWACVRRPKPGFAGIFFFAVLAPTSSFIPVATQTIATHRMYLALAAVVALAVTGAWLLATKAAAKHARFTAAWAACGVALAAALAALTLQRNTVYESNLTLWADTLAKLPGKDRARAHNNLANALIDAGRAREAIPHCVEAVRLNPDFQQAHNNHGYALSKLGRFNDALLHYDKALGFVQAGLEITLNNRGYALYNLGRLDEAVKDFMAALKVRPAYAEARSNFANVLCALGRHGEALAQLDEAIRIDPGFAAAWNNRGNVFAASGNDTAEAMRCYKRAVGLDPDMVLAIDNVARYSMLLGDPAGAIPYLEMQLRRMPGDVAALQRMGNALMLAQRQAESVPYFERALALQPNLFAVHHNLAIALQNSGRAAAAIAHYETALKLSPGQAPVHHNLAGALAELGRYDEAIAHEREALRIQPDFTWAREQLEELRRKQRAAAEEPAPPGMNSPSLASNRQPRP